MLTIDVTALKREPDAVSYLDDVILSARVHCAVPPAILKALAALRSEVASAPITKQKARKRK